MIVMINTMAAITPAEQPAISPTGTDELAKYQTILRISDYLSKFTLLHDYDK